MLDPEVFAEMFPRAVANGWEYVDDSVLMCPCGDNIEWDGECAEGHVSPIRRAGLI